MTDPIPPGFTAHMLDFEINEAFIRLRHLILTKADHDLSRVNQVLHENGIDHPQGAAGVSDLASFANTRQQAIVDAMNDEQSKDRTLKYKVQGTEWQLGFDAGLQHMISFVEIYGDPE